MNESIEILERRAEAMAKRQAFPFATKIGDELRSHFPGARVTWAREAGRDVGTPSAPGVTPAIDWLAKGKRG